MDLRMADESDLPRLKAMYEKIIDDMNRKGISIWDEVYPCTFFSDDIKQNCLYLLAEERGDIAAAFALCESHEGEGHMRWGNPREKAVYLDRFGVNVDYAGRGIGSLMLRYAAALAKQKGAKYLRLFVVDINKPAINVYLKNGLKQVDGLYEERIDDTLTLRQYGFEIELSK